MIAPPFATRVRALLPAVITGFWLVAVLSTHLSAQAPGSVAGEEKIAHGTGSFPLPLDDGDAFGRASAVLNDIDSNGVHELVIGASGDDDGAPGAGALWVLFLDAAGSVQSRTKISALCGGFAGPLASNDGFGSSVADLGDLDGDGVPDLAVGAPGSDTGGPDRGAVWILFLNTDGTVKSTSLLSDTGAPSFLDDGDAFGTSVSAIGDLDGDGVVDLAVGAVGDDDGGADRGALWILYLMPDGAVKSHVKLSQLHPSFGGVLDDGDRFGSSVASDSAARPGTAILAVGATHDDDGGSDRGALWVLLLDASATIRGSKILSSVSGLPLADGDAFGSSVCFPGDIDDDGVGDIAVGAPLTDDGGVDRGAVHLLFMNSNGTLHGWMRLSSTSGLFNGLLADGDRFGTSLCAPGDMNDDGFEDILVGAPGDDTGGADRGATWVTWLYGCPDAAVTPRNGSGVNSMRLTAEGTPTFQSLWNVDVDCTGRVSGSVFLVGAASPAEGVFLRAGEILIDVNSPLYIIRSEPHSGGITGFRLGIPSDPAFCSFEIYMQSIILGGPGAILTNALDWLPGR